MHVCVGSSCCRRSKRFWAIAPPDIRAVQTCWSWSFIFKILIISPSLENYHLMMLKWSFHRTIKSWGWKIYSILQDDCIVLYSTRWLHYLVCYSITYFYSWNLIVVTLAYEVAKSVKDCWSFCSTVDSWLKLPKMMSALGIFLIYQTHWGCLSHKLVRSVGSSLLVCFTFRPSITGMIRSSPIIVFNC